MFSGLRLIPLEVKSLASGQRPIIQLMTLPPKYRVRGFLFRAVLAVVQSGSPVLVTGTTLSRILSSVVIGKRVRATGMLLDRLNWLTIGKDFNLPADVPAAVGTYQRIVEQFVPITDPKAFDPGDTAPSCMMYRDEAIELDCGDYTATFGATCAITGTLKGYAVVEPHDGQVVATPARINYADFNQQTLYLPRGAYSHIFLYKETGAAIDTTEVSRVSVTVDGEQIINRATPDDLACEFNLIRGLGAGVQLQSATAPVAGEELTTEPGVAAGAAATVSLECIPIIFAPDRYKITRLLNAESQVQLDLEGSLTAVRVAYRMLEEQGPMEVAKAAAKMGVGHLTAMRSKTISKSAVTNPRHARLLPKRLGAEGNEG